MRLARGIAEREERVFMSMDLDTPEGSRHIPSVKMYTDDAPAICPPTADI